MAESLDSKEKIVLCLGGAFNPVHSRHVMAMILGKKWLENNTNYEVIAGRLAVAHDGYVKTKTRKSGCKCMKSAHRIKLCEIACAPHKDWLAPYPLPTGSALEAGKKTKSEIMKLKSDANVKIAVVIGADRAVTKFGRAKWHKDCSHITLCIGRKGETGRIFEKYSKDKEENNVENSQFFLVPEELDNVSSTAVRQVLAKLDNAEIEKEKVIETLITDEWISKDMGYYILENLSDIYLDL